MDGICTLANDLVYDQLVALLNSIKINARNQISVCVYPYDHNIQKITAEIATRPNVELYCNRNSLHNWDNFVRQIWDSHPTAKQQWKKARIKGYHRIGTHRRFCAFDNPFDRFIYLDADTLLLSSVEHIFNLLEENDCLVYDFQYKDPTHVYQVNAPNLYNVFSPERIATEIFCSGFYGSKKNLFTSDVKQELLTYLHQGESEILYPFAPDQTILNYMMMRGNFTIYNLALNLPQEKKTGCCVTSSHFEQRKHLLYDKNQPLTYLHYIGLSSNLFTRLCKGENIDLPYRDIFLYYRYLHEPEKRPLLRENTTI